ncbi:hypothetical protein NliqN6_6277 [Naganishia liquefaciens]|uniref:chitin deacetylase n=1 Tax=Naganishia liquefaciens TaxID=104408 RepID=A0A8H3YHD9_9TREE|nr:hypothetical protein NliqN6_6277 [Naganishia liquefaciens]
MKLTFAFITSTLIATAAAMPLEERKNHVDWYQDPRGDVAKLFIREGGKPGKPSPGPQFGSDAWKALYPPTDKVPDVSTIPASWLARLKALKKTSAYPAGIPLTTADASGNFVYPAGTDPTSAEVCSFPAGCNKATDFYDSPDGVLALSFDDGPTASTTNLTHFIAKNKISASHNMIGSRIVQFPEQYRQIETSSGHLSCHTWSHQHMSSLTDEQIVAEIGFTLQIVFDASGVVPAFWRPPYGDLDNRIRFIAESVFNLITVTWNRDSRDWAIPSLFSQTVPLSIEQVTSYVNGSKSPGMNILEHELNDACVSVFEGVYPAYVSNGWDIRNLPQALSKGKGKGKH